MSEGGTCENCGRDDDHLLEVHRVYVTPEAWDTPGSTKVMPEVERWCYSCRTQYAWQGVEGDAQA